MLTSTVQKHGEEENHSLTIMEMYVWQRPCRILRQDKVGNEQGGLLY